jgi:hypothetical protein
VNISGLGFIHRDTRESSLTCSSCSRLPSKSGAKVGRLLPLAGQRDEIEKQENERRLGGVEFLFFFF